MVFVQCVLNGPITLVRESSGKVMVACTCCRSCYGSCEKVVLLQDLSRHESRQNVNVIDC